MYVQYIVNTPLQLIYNFLPSIKQENVPIRLATSIYFTIYTENIFHKQKNISLIITVCENVT